MIITEPKWKSWIVETTTPVFTPEQCQQIIECGKRQPSETGQDDGKVDAEKRASTVSWIPFKEMESMYDHINQLVQRTNDNHFGFDGIQITEPAQYTEYPEGGFYDWHMDCAVDFAHEPPVRKISMVLLLSPEDQFEGGDLELVEPGKFARLKQGHAMFFASFLRHRVSSVSRGVRQSLVMWFGGKPFK